MARYIRECSLFRRIALVSWDSEVQMESNVRVGFLCQRKVLVLLGITAATVRVTPRLNASRITVGFRKPRKSLTHYGSLVRLNPAVVSRVRQPALDSIPNSFHVFIDGRRFDDIFLNAEG